MTSCRASSGLRPATAFIFIDLLVQDHWPRCGRGTTTRCLISDTRSMQRQRGVYDFDGEGSPCLCSEAFEIARKGGQRLAHLEPHLFSLARHGRCGVTIQLEHYFLQPPWLSSCRGTMQAGARVANERCNAEQVFIAQPPFLHRACLGRYRGIGIAARLTRTPGSVRRAPPKFGANSAEILRENGYTECAIQSLLTRRC
jgi:hypothetical protein